jgi:N-formylglutamate amidohydrolase
MTVQTTDQTPVAFRRLGPQRPQTPVVISVPHAGRAYPDCLRTYTKLPPALLASLEDRLADLLVKGLEAAGHVLLVANAPRAWIDLNRAEDDVDPQMINPRRAPSRPVSAKVRGGLGLIPRRTSQLGEIWHRNVTTDELTARLNEVHRPYHQALESAMAAAAERFGEAILIDLHTMPSLPVERGRRPPQIVIGDRFGRSCHGRFAARAMGLAEVHGFRVDINAPYAGGYVLDRHGKPSKSLHAVQIEIDRALYLQPNMREAGPGLDAMQEFVAALAAALSDEIVRPLSIAAE